VIIQVFVVGSITKVVFRVDCRTPAYIETIIPVQLKVGQKDDARVGCSGWVAIFAL